MRRLKPEKVARLARERLADRIERREANRARLAGLQDREVGDGDAHAVGEFGQRHPPVEEHTVELIQLMKRDGVKVIVVEPYFDLKTPNSIARETGGQVLVLMPSVGGEKEITDYFKLFDYNIAKLKQAFDTTK